MSDPVFTLVCAEQPTVTADGGAVCGSGWQSQIAAAPFNSDDLDVSSLVEVYSWGWVFFIVPWVAAFGMSSVVKAIRQF